MEVYCEKQGGGGDLFKSSREEWKGRRAEVKLNAETCWGGKKIMIQERSGDDSRGGGNREEGGEGAMDP